jgi:hypothetical protein
VLETDGQVPKKSPESVTSSAFASARKKQNSDLAEPPKLLRMKGMSSGERRTLVADLAASNNAAAALPERNQVGFFGMTNHGTSAGWFAAPYS